jgi:hypothetical protein
VALFPAAGQRTAGTGWWQFVNDRVRDVPQRRSLITRVAAIAEGNGDFEWFKHMVYDHDHTRDAEQLARRSAQGNPYCRGGCAWAITRARGLLGKIS